MHEVPLSRKIIKILGDEPMEAEAHLVTVPTTTPAPSVRDTATEAVDNVKKIFSPRSIDMNQYQFPDNMKIPWEILLKIRYTPSKGQGCQEQGMTDALGTPEERNGIGLGYLRYPMKDVGKPLAWSLSNHFISVGL